MPESRVYVQLNTKRPEPCTIQDPDRSGCLVLNSNFWGCVRVQVNPSVQAKRKAREQDLVLFCMGQAGLEPATKRL